MTSGPIGLKNVDQVRDIKVSVVIPVYNVEQYLRDCLDSVVQQTLREIEIICVNDASTDNSLKILDDYAARDNRIRIVNKGNGGVSSARNAAFSLLRGKYTIFVDSDDTISPDLCRMASICAEYHNADVVLYSSLAYDYRIDIFKAMTIRSQPFLGVGSPTEKPHKLYSDHAPWRKLVRTEHLQTNDLRFAEGLRYEDILYSWQLYLSTNRIAYIPVPLYFYRNRPGSIMKKKKSQYNDIFDIFSLLKKHLEKKGCYEQHRKEFARQKLYNLYHLGFEQFGWSSKKQIREKIRMSLTNDEWDYVLSNASMGRHRRNFYKAMRGDLIAKIKFSLYWWCLRCPREIISSFGAGVVKDRLEYLVAKRYTPPLLKRHQKICEYITKLQEENILLRKDKEYTEGPQSK